MTDSSGAKRQTIGATIGALLLVAVIDLLTNSIDTVRFSWDFRYYFEMAEHGLSGPLASPFAYRYLIPMLVHGLSLVTDPEDLYQDLQETRERGFAISKEEYEKDINAVAAPILDASGCPIAVIAIVGPSYRLSDDRMMMLGQSILETTSIAREVGLAALPIILPKATTPCVEESPE